MLYILGFEHEVMFQRSDYSWYVNTDAKVIDFGMYERMEDIANKYDISVDELLSMNNHMVSYGYSEFYNFSNDKKHDDKHYHVVMVPFIAYRSKDKKYLNECYNFLYNHVILQKRDESIGILLD